MTVSCKSRASETTGSPKHCQRKTRRMGVRFASRTRNTHRIKNCSKQNSVLLKWVPRCKPRRSGRCPPSAAGWPCGSCSCWHFLPAAQNQQLRSAWRWLKTKYELLRSCPIHGFGTVQILPPPLNSPSRGLSQPWDTSQLWRLYIFVAWDKFRYKFLSINPHTAAQQMGAQENSLLPPSAPQSPWKQRKGFRSQADTRAFLALAMTHLVTIHCSFATWTAQ